MSDIDADLPTIEKEKVTPKFRKMRFPNPRSKSTKKRKVENVYDLNDPAANLLTASELMIKSYLEKVETIDELRTLAAERTAVHEKDAIELNRLRKEFSEMRTTLNRYIFESKVMAAEKEKMIEKAKNDAVMAVLEARILLVSQAAARGYDTSIWDVNAWKLRLAKLKDQDPDVAVDLEDTSGDDSEIRTTLANTSHKANKAPKKKATKAPKRKASKAPKPTSSKAPSSMKNKIPEPEDNEDTVSADPVNEVIKDLTEVATDDENEGGSILGEDGI